MESWYEDQFVKDKVTGRKHGEFKDLAGYDKENGYNNWVLCTDGYYYYTLVVPPVTENPAAATTSKLFTEYLLKQIPVVQNAGVVTDPTTMHFELEIATQAIYAVQLDGSQYESWDVGWASALGETPVAKTN